MTEHERHLFDASLRTLHVAVLLMESLEPERTRTILRKMAAVIEVRREKKKPRKRS